MPIANDQPQAKDWELDLVWAQQCIWRAQEAAKAGLVHDASAHLDVAIVRLMKARREVLLD